MAVYPSFLQMSKYELMAFGNNTWKEASVKFPKEVWVWNLNKKKFALGDDIRQINWRATARHGDVMVNRYTEEKAKIYINALTKED